MSEFSSQETLDLIELWRKKQCLWDMNSNLYKRTDLKQRAWEEIADHFNSNIEAMKKKIRSIRNAYVFELKKVKASQKSGSSGDVYSPKLFYFKELDSFLRSSVSMRKTTENTEDLVISTNIDEAEEATEMNISFTEDVESLPSSKKKRVQNPRSSKKWNPNKYEDAVAAIVKNCKPKSNDDDVLFLSFAKSIAQQIKLLEPLECNQTMCDVQVLVSKAVQASIKKKSQSASTSCESIFTTSSSSSYSQRHNILNDALSSADINFELNEYNFELNE